MGSKPETLLERIEMLKDWLKTLISGKPHFVVGEESDPYLLRWYILPRNRFLNLYLHKFLHSDDDRALHDHPWWFASLMIKGAYMEHTDNGVNCRFSGSIALRKSTHRHRVELFEDFDTGEPFPCWTLILTGPKRRVWGFWCPKGFVPWYTFVDGRQPGRVGRGCGEID